MHFRVGFDIGLWGLAFEIGVFWKLIIIIICAILGLELFSLKFKLKLNEKSQSKGEIGQIQVSDLFRPNSYQLGSKRGSFFSINLSLPWLKSEENPSWQFIALQTFAKLKNLLKITQNAAKSTRFSSPAWALLTILITLLTFNWGLRIKTSLNYYFLTKNQKFFSS